MRNKIKVGEYVRTDKGYIFKIDKEKKNLQIVKFFDAEYGKIVKHSKQLIDLIGCGDIVNRHLIIDKYEDVDEYGNDFWCLIIEDDSLLNKTIREEDIKTILTKESYMANCYKVGGEDECM